MGSELRSPHATARDLSRVELVGVYNAAGSATTQDLFGIRSPGLWATPTSTAFDLSIGERLNKLEAILTELLERLEERPVVYSAQLLDLGDPRYGLLQPLLVTIEVHPDEVVACVPEYNLYATGASDAVALMNLKAEIVSTYEHLEALGTDRLGPMPRQWLASMRKAIEPTDG